MKEIHEIKSGCHQKSDKIDSNLLIASDIYFNFAKLPPRLSFVCNLLFIGLP